MKRFITEEQKKEGLKWNDFTHAVEKPMFIHDCDECEFLGTFENHDLYICRPNLGSLSMLARYGNEPSEYTSGIDIFGAAIIMNDDRRDVRAKVSKEFIRRAYKLGKIDLEIKSTYRELTNPSTGGIYDYGK